MLLSAPREKAVDLGSIPVCVANLITDAGRDEQLVVILAVRIEVLPGAVSEVREPTLKSTSHPWPRLPPGPKSRQRSQFGQAVLCGKSPQNEISSGCG